MLNTTRYKLPSMILSFRSKPTRSLFEGKAVAQFANIRVVAERKLQMLNRAARLDDLRVPPNNRLEALAGNRKGQHSIRINEQWRLCFVWTGTDATDVEIVDYH